jgi:HTH-type transcriptional regulator/antitoxin HigA
MKRPATKTRGSGKRNANGRIAPTYLALIKRFPLRLLRSEREYDTAAAVLDCLAVRPEGSLDPGEQDYFDALTLLIEEYDRIHCNLDAPDGDPLTMLQYLMQEAGMTQADLGRLLGNRALASLVLNRRRQLSKAIIRKLANYFKVSPALFLETNHNKLTGTLE